MGTMFLIRLINCLINRLINCLKLAWQLRIPDLIRVEVRDAQAHTVFELEGANIVQELSPALALLEIFSCTTREKDVTGIATIHYLLGHVDGGGAHICPLVHVSYTKDRSTVNAHPHSQAQIVLQRTTDLYRALGRFLGGVVKNHRDAVACGDL